jgi:hypothetical protein
MYTWGADDDCKIMKKKTGMRGTSAMAAYDFITVNASNRNTHILLQSEVGGNYQM